MKNGSLASSTTRAMVGIVGAGQLARMTLQAAIPLDITIRLLAASADDGAATIWRDVLVGAPDDADVMKQLAACCDVVTFDHELVPPAILATLEQTGFVLRPSAKTMALAQDKQQQRETHARLGLPIPPFRITSDPREIPRFAADHGWPVVAKIARGGYDGRGVWILDNSEAVSQFAREIAGRETALVLEPLLPLDQELAILVARRPDGEQEIYPLVETVQIAGINREIIAPARVSNEMAIAAREIARRVADAADVTGVMAIELFATGGRLVINEIATRPHNSGHYTIEGATTSQFEQHLRAILDLPLGETTLIAPHVVTVNVLGPADGSDPASRIGSALGIPGAHVHLYGKTARPGRKLGHVTVTGDDLDETRDRAWSAVERLTGERRPF